MSDGKRNITWRLFELMKDIPNGSIDMILADLPYGITQNKYDIILPFDKLWEQYERIIKDNAIVLFGQGLFFVDLINSNRKLFRYDLVWDKQLISGFLNANRMPLRVHENIAVLQNFQPTTHNILKVNHCIVKENHT